MVRRWPARRWSLGLAFLTPACNQAGKIVHVQKPQAALHADAHAAGAAGSGSGCAGAGSGSPVGGGSAGVTTDAKTGKPCTPAPATAAPPVDVVLLVAVSPTAPQAKTKIPETIASLAKLVAASAGAGLHFALIAKDTTALLDAAKASLNASNAKGVDAPLSPAHTLVAALAAGCDKKMTAFPALVTSSTGPTVCGQPLLAIEGDSAEKLGGAGLSALDPVRDAVTGFLRAGSPRAYVVLADGDAELIDAKTWTAVVKAQNAGRAAPVFVLAPKVNGPVGDCLAGTPAAKTLADIAAATGGSLASYCDADWQPAITTIAAAIAAMK